MNPLNATWLNSEAIADTVMDWLRQPMTIAMVASLGAHGLLFLGLPAVTGKAKQPDTRTVGVVTLTPEEMAQLPKTTEIAQPPAKTLPLPHSPLTAALPQGMTSGPALPSLDFPESSPTGSTFYNVPLGSLNPPSEGLFSPTLRQLINNPYSSGSETPRSATSSATNSTKTQASAPRTILTPKVEFQTGEPETNPTPPQNSQTQQTNPVPQQTATPQPSPTSASPQQVASASQLQQPSPASTARPSPNSPSPVGSTNPVTPQMSPPPATPVGKTQPEVEKSYNPDDAVQDQAKSLSKMTKWAVALAKAQNVSDDSVNLKKIIAGDLLYPYGFQLSHLSPNPKTLLGVLIQADGKVSNPNDVWVLQGTGYSDLNNFVISELLKRTFKATGKKEVRTVEFGFTTDSSKVAPQQILY